MAKEKILYECSACGASHPKWAGQCASCSEWNTLVEKKEVKNSMTLTREGNGNIIDFSRENTPKTTYKKISTGLKESDRVLGGGILPDALTLLTGNPGIGKSTLALQIARNIAKENPSEEVYYFSGEESAFQVMGRCERLGDCPQNLKVASAIQIEDVISTAKDHPPKLMVVDSVQTFVSPEATGTAGSSSQIRTVTEQLMHMTKTKSIPVILIGQVTKEGVMAGPQLLAHLVDTVLQFEGDEQHELRMLRATKNRFGSTSEVGIFDMTEKGLAEVKNPSAAFLSGRLPGAIGSAIFPAIEGQRPFLVEIQALTAATPFGLPKRATSGTPLSRLGLLIAVLEKHAGINLSSSDAFANVVGGINIKETAADLALCLALASSKENISIPEKMFILGEVGLSGEVRAVSQLEKRLKEGEKLGFTTAIIPANQKVPKTGLKLIPVKTVGEAVKEIRK